MGSDQKIYAFEDVANHYKSKDCWLLINEKVYDVSSFMENHPGGEDVLISSSAKDATLDFEDIGHSDDAIKMLEKYYIGDIDKSTIPLKQAYTPLKVVEHNADKTPGFVINILQFLVPLLILGLAFAVRHYTKEK